MAKKVRQSKLLNVISRLGTQPPGFALLLGAGASISSGVKSGQTMVDEWREESYLQNLHNDESKEEYLSRQEWYKKPYEYGRLFEEIYDLPAQRRKYIESCLDGCSPSWGYTYLANLLTKRYFNVIFTTNFDDLVSDVCYKFQSAPKPIVCAHDSNIDSVRLLSSRPKIVKLHGDCLYDNIKNTTSETSVLEKNMYAKVEQFAGEYGLIVIGHGGHDISIMETLKKIVGDSKNFKNGIYWCVRNPEDVSDRLEDLGECDRVHLVQIDGFDEFMAELNEHLGIGLPRELSSPYEALAARCKRLVGDFFLTGRYLFSTLPA